VPCVGGNGAVDRLGFSDTSDFGEIEKIATALLSDDAFYDRAVADSLGHAHDKLSFAPVARELGDFFGQLATPIASR
jgi:hypothetical protein